MIKNKLYVAVLVSILFSIGTPVAYAQYVIGGPQGGTGIGSALAGDIGKCLQVLSNSPFTYALASCGSGGGGGSGVGWASTTDPTSIYFTGSGKVGIGSTTPASILGIAGANPFITVGQTSSGNFYGLKMINGANTTATFAVNDGSGEVRMGATSGGGYFSTFYSNGTEKMRIDSAGNIGIATSTPFGLLSINANRITGPSFVIGSSTRTDLQVTNGGQLQMQNGVNATPAYSFINSPTFGMYVNGSADNVISLGTTAGINFGAGNSELRMFATNGIQFGTSVTNGRAVYLNSPATAVFDITGNNTTGSAISVGISTTSPWGMLSVNPNGITGPSFAIGSTTGTIFSIDNGAGLMSLNALSGGNPVLQLSSAGTTVGRFQWFTNNLLIDSNASGSAGGIIFRTGNGATTALTLSSAQLATFAGPISMGTNAIRVGFINDRLNAVTAITIADTTGILNFPATAGNIGIASTTPYGLLSINPNGISGPAFVIGSSTKTSFQVNNAGETILSNSGIANINMKMTDAGLYWSRSTDGGYTSSLLSDQSTGPVITLTAQGNIVLKPSAATYTFDGSGTISAVALAATGGSFKTAGNVSMLLDFDPGANVDQGAWVKRGNRAHSENSGIMAWGYGTFATANDFTEVARITYGGKMGIGTSTPWGILSVGTSTVPAVPLFVIATSTATTATTTVFIVDKNGNTGISTTTPSQALSVQGNALISGSASVASVTSTGSITYGTSNAGVSGILLSSSLNTFLMDAGGGGRTATMSGASWTMGQWGGDGTLAMASGGAGNANRAGNNLNIVSGQSTGDQVGGDLIFKSSSAGSTGSALNTLNELVRIKYSGNVGIGTSTPNNLLSVSSSGATPIELYRTVTGNTNIKFWNPTAAMYAGLNGNGDFGISNNVNFASAPYFVVASSTGNVGIGSSSPSALLSIGASGAASGGIYLSNNYQGIGTTTPGQSALLGVAGHIFSSGTVYANNFVDTSVSGSTCIGETNGLLGTSNCVSSIASAGGTLTISSPTGAVDASLNLGHANLWTASTTFVGGLSAINGTTTNATSTNLAVTTICLTGDTCRTTWPTGGGSQTPWTSNISGGGFNLLNAGQLTGTSTIATSTVAASTTSATGTVITGNVPCPISVAGNCYPYNLSTSTAQNLASTTISGIPYMDQINFMFTASSSSSGGTTIPVYLIINGVQTASYHILLSEIDTGGSPTSVASDTGTVAQLNLTQDYSYMISGTISNIPGQFKKGNFQLSGYINDNRVDHHTVGNFEANIPGPITSITFSTDSSAKKFATTTYMKVWGY